MESDSENELDVRPPDLLKVELNSPPELSKKKYETAYKWFMDWKKDNYDSSSCSEKVLLHYFKELSTKFKSSTLWAQYSMLRTTVNINNNVDISNYLQLKAFLKQQSSGYQPKKWKTFTPQHINQFITQAPDDQYLLAKVALIMGVMGGCRRHELHQMNASNINDLGSAVIVTIPNTRTKFLRTFTITGYHYEIFKKYADLRPANVNDSSFFLNYLNGKCGTMRVGINKFGAMGKEIARYLKLPNPELYTGHNFRKSCATVLVDADEYITSSRESPRKSAEKYVTDILSNNKAIESRLEDKCVEDRQELTVIKHENTYEEFAAIECEELLDNKCNEFMEDKCKISTSDDTNGTESSSTAKKQVWEQKDNVNFEYTYKNLPKIIFHNCTNVTINLINSNK